MSRLSLLSPHDIQLNLAEAVRIKRKALKFSRQKLSEQSSVPASTIKKFEMTGQISLRQFILLWQCVDELQRLDDLCRPKDRVPQNIDEVLAR